MRALATIAAVFSFAVMPSVASAASSCRAVNTGLFPSIGPLRATNTSCSVAREIAAAIQGSYSRHHKLPAAIRFTPGGTFRCSYALKQGHPNPYMAARCHRGRAVVTAALGS